MGRVACRSRLSDEPGGLFYRMDLSQPLHADSKARLSNVRAKSSGSGVVATASKGVRFAPKRGYKPDRCRERFVPIAAGYRQPDLWVDRFGGEQHGKRKRAGSSQASFATQTQAFHVDTACPLVSGQARDT